MSRSMYTRAFVKSAKVSEKSQNNLGESTHPIGRTRLMKIMMQLSSEANRSTYANAPN